MLFCVPALAQMYPSGKAQAFISTARDAGYTMRAKDYLALYRFTEKVFLTGATIGYDTTGAEIVYNYTESGSTMLALYPVIGTSTASQAINLAAAGTGTVAPSYFGAFVGSPTPGDGFCPWNGTTQYFRSNIPLNAFNSYTTISMSYYSYTSNAALSMVDMGTLSGTYPTLAIYVRFTGNWFYGLTKETGLSGRISCLTSSGFRIINRTRSDSTQFYNNVEHLGTVASTRSSASFSTNPLTIGAATNGTTTNLFSNRTWAGSHVGYGLSYAQAFSLGMAFVDLKNRKL